MVLSGNVLVSIPCGTWTIHYVIDGMRWDFYWAYPPSYHCRQGMQALMGGDGAEYNSLWSLAWTYPILDYVEDHSWIHLTDEVTASLCGPSPIDAHVQIHFNGYVKPDGSDGKDWLPSPGDSIGLKFGFQSDVTGPINVRYTISDISMWAGRCMNEPWAAPAPRHTGLKGEAPNPITGTQFYFDAWIGDPAQYDLKVYDLKSSLDPLYAEYMGIPDSVSFDSLSKSISTLVAEKEVRGPSSDDILWIVARDYGMDCSVTPTASAFQGKLAFMQALVTEFGDSVYNVTVPRDNDGIDTLSVGFATGDFMADAWEEKCFPDSLGYDIREIQPFIDTAATAASYPVMDKDSIPRGRKVLNCYWDGDYLTNWEEYRGFIVLSDSLDITSDSTHRRTNPREKTVFVHFRPDIQSDVADNIPKFIFQMPGVDVYNTNYLQTNLERNSSERKISENRTGASTLYPPLLYPRSVPINDSYRPNAVTFWRALTSDNDPINDLDTLYSIQNGIARFSFGGTISHGFAFHGEKVVIPSVTSRIIVRTGSIYQYGRLSSYYDTDSELWRNTYSRLIQRNISHEFGHSVGMNHVDRSTGGFMYIPEPMQNEAYPWPEEIYPTGSMIQFLVRRPLP
ncbi:hypothetical protein KKH18_13530 [bacterium]|nr:hypothetical protein [bacterium]